YAVRIGTVDSWIIDGRQVSGKRGGDGIGIIAPRVAIPGRGEEPILHADAPIRIDRRWRTRGGRLGPALARTQYQPHEAHPEDRQRSNADWACNHNETSSWIVREQLG